MKSWRAAGRHMFIIAAVEATMLLALSGCRSNTPTSPIPDESAPCGANCGPPPTTTVGNTIPQDSLPDFSFPTLTTIPNQTGTQPIPPPTHIPSTEPVSLTVPAEPSDADVKACEERVTADDVKATFAQVLPMTVGKSSTVVVILTVGGVSLPVNETIPGASVTTTKTFKQLTCEVAAQLRALNFQIDNPNKIPQSFLGTDQLTWSWNVTPNNTDANEVDVDFYPVIRTSTGQLIAGQRRTATLTIDVKAAKGQSGGTRALKWIIGALLVALAALTVDWVAFLFGPNKDAKGGGLLIRRWPTRARRARSSKQPPDKGARDDPTTPDAAPSPPDNPTGR